MEGHEEEAPVEAEEKKFICSVCEALVVPVIVETTRGPRTKCPECKKFMRPLSPEDVAAKIKEKEEEVGGPLPPSEIEMVNRIKTLLQDALPNVYGIPKQFLSKRIKAILDTLSPAVTGNPLSLHMHIKNFAPSADDKHLHSIITKIYSTMRAEGYQANIQTFPPRYDGMSQSQQPYRLPFYPWFPRKN